MSVCKREGKDIIILASKEDHDIPSKIELAELEPQPGLIFPNGEINWNCPCLGGMATGPCGVEFREAFTCFHHSTADPKGSDCVERFQEMQQCFSKYPAVYDNKDGKDDYEDGLDDNIDMNGENSSPSGLQEEKVSQELAPSVPKEKN